MKRLVESKQTDGSNTMMVPEVDAVVATEALSTTLTDVQSHYKKKLLEAIKEKLFSTARELKILPLKFKAQGLLGSVNCEISIRKTPLLEEEKAFLEKLGVPIKEKVIPPSPAVYRINPDLLNDIELRKKILSKIKEIEELSGLEILMK